MQEALQEALIRPKRDASYCSRNYARFKCSVVASYCKTNNLVINREVNCRFRKIYKKCSQFHGSCETDRDFCAFYEIRRRLRCNAHSIRFCLLCKVARWQRAPAGGITKGREGRRKAPFAQDRAAVVSGLLSCCTVIPCCVCTGYHCFTLGTFLLPEA